MNETTLDTVGVAELKARLSHYLRGVRAGRELMITDRGRAVARLVPVTDDPSQTDRVAELVATGAARAPLRPLPASFRQAGRPSDSAGRSVEFLLEERHEGR